MTDIVNNVALIKAVVTKELLKKDFTGREGPKGDKGDEGPKGASGDRGQPGEQGPKGAQGPQGDRGPQGSQGPTGPVGKVGEKGPQGLSGPTGQRGPKGDKGERGPKGDSGDEGRGVKSVKVNDKNMLVVTYDDGETEVAGKVSVNGKTEVIQNGAGIPLGHFAIYSVSIDDDNQLIVRCNNNKTFVIPTLRAVDIGGFADYNHSNGSSSPVTLVDGEWTDIPNDGVGPFTNLKLPTGVTRLLDPSTGAILVDELPIGSSIIIRMDYSITPTTNNAALDFRYTLGGGSGAYTLEMAVNRLDEGSGIPYRQALVAHYIYIGDENTKINPIQPQVKVSGGGTLNNAGMVIEVRKSDGNY